MQVSTRFFLVHTVHTLTYVILQDSSNILQWGWFAPAPAEDGLSTDGFFWCLSCCTLWCLRSQRTAAWPHDLQIWPHDPLHFSALTFLLHGPCNSGMLEYCRYYADIIYEYIWYMIWKRECWLEVDVGEIVATCFDKIRHILSAGKIIEMACL